MQTYTLRSSELFLDGMVPGSNKDKRYILKIKDMPTEDKPREKLIKNGPSALSSAELLAIILANGTTKEGVIEMSTRILKEYGEKALIGQKNAEHMAKSLDIPLVKAMQVVACGELGRRFFEPRSGGASVIRTPKDVFEYVTDMWNLPKEHLRGLYLNTHHRIVHDEVISIGTIDTNILHPREVFKPAVEYGASAVVLVHNHPSGVVSPSQADIEITKQLVEVGKMLGIHLIDHVIVTKGEYASIDVNYQ